MKRPKSLLHDSPLPIREKCLYEIQIHSFLIGAECGRELNRKNAKICCEFFGAELCSSNRRQHTEFLF